ncbi:MAG: MMPL family transporter [Candidatus Electrothrix aestuarii]|uniref:MMPL family transporter n=1 Tax=Candidatus Electrothrix aestuarii TaxID=3062594 RepID=A0AAU8LY23_9BACT|nr:MMPL family transporter [Candidatus Electrothrix aestuarii]
MINYKNLFVVSCVLIALTIFGLLRLQIDTDVVRSLPTQEKSIADGIQIFEQHPIHDQIAIDISLIKANPDRLVKIGKALEEKFEQSGFFAQVGTDSLGSLIPELALYAAKHLPLLFTEKELKDKVTPLLEPEQINQRLQKLYQELSGMEGIGQAEFMGLDPLGLKDLILARMAPLAPSLNSQFYQGSLLSKDGHHLLVTARPKASGTDTASARQISQFLGQVEQELTRQYPEEKIQLTPVGAYRAALDNEEIIRHDVNLALVLATLGIALLLYFAFPRPLTGLLAFVPALAGTGVSLFIYSLLHSSISIMVLGFGGALISITVDHGIAYLLFLDRPQKTRGQEASREVRAIALMAVVTSVCAFLILSSSGFPVFVQLGQFTALGILFSYLFVHTIFPRLFPSMPPAEHTRSLPLRRFVDRLYGTGKPGAIAALLLFICLAFFAKPQFHVDLTSMNTMSTETQAADALFTEVWGNINERVILMRSVDSLTELQNGNDQLLAKVEEDTAQDVLAGAFVPSMLFPGQERAKENFRAWHTFWNDERVQQVQEKFTRMGEELGFAPAAFAPFFTQLQQTEIVTINPITIPEKFYELLGIRHNSERTGLLQFLTLIPGKNYTAQEAVQRYGQDASFFDAKYFTARLAEILFSTFRKMLVIIALSIVLLLALFYLDLRQTLFTLLPPFFAYICTLGTLHLIGHPLDIPALMLSIVILGMGVDYSVFCVRAHQRYQDIAHPSYALVRTAVFMAGASTLIGFGVLCFAEHAVLRSIGIASFLGIGYSLLGTFLLLPPLLDRFLFSQQQEGTEERKNMDVEARVRHRYRTLEAYTRMFARFKLRYDPMFADLPTMLAYKQGEIKTVIDIGCGYGVPACWCLEKYPGAVIYGIDPDSERVRSATIAFAGQGKAICGYAPELPPTPSPADLVLLLDMFHYLDDETAAAVLHNSFEALDKNGLLVTRFVIRPVGKLSWNWYLEDWRIKSSGGRAYYRPANRMAEFMRQAGFTVVYNEVSAVNRELIWLTGKKEEGGVKE